MATIGKRWNTAESHLVYLVGGGIAYAKAMGRTPEDLGTFSGNDANWEDAAKKDPKVLRGPVLRHVLALLRRFSGYAARS